MKDINFFSVYSKQKNAVAGKTLKAVLITAIVVLVIGGSYAALTLYRVGMDRESARIDAYLLSDEVGAKVAAINKYNYDQSIIDQYGQMVNEVLKNLDASDTMNSARLEIISASLPDGISMKSISVQDNLANMVFSVPDLAAAGQLVTILTASECFSTVSLTNIEGAEIYGGMYAATVTAILKGGDAT